MAPLFLLLTLTGCGHDPGDGTGLGTGTDTGVDSSATPDTDCQPTEELCDGLDEDCDGLVDEALPETTWYADRDGDGHGNAAESVVDCHDGPPQGHVADATDCDDDDPATHPGAEEICGDGRWNACQPDDGCRLSGFISLADAGLVIVGEEPEDLAGRSAAWTGDLDGDGFDDLFLDAQESDVGGPQSGSSYLFPGPLGPGTLDLGDAPTRLRGDAQLTWSARSLAGVGDTNGDGLDDVIVGVIRDGAAGYRAGAAYLFQGPLPVGEHSLPDVGDAFLTAEGESEAAGSWTRGAGDIDGDGLDDLLISAMYSDRAGLNNGAVYVVYGPVFGRHALVDRADAIYDGEPLRDNDWAGRTAAGAGDVNLDGYGDVVIGADGNDRGGNGAGAAYLVLGPLSGAHNLVDADTIYIGEFDDHRLGGAVDAAGDTDGDGQPELILGAFGHSEVAEEGGAFYLVDATERGVVSVQDHEPFVYSAVAREWLGYYVDGIGDADGDGLDDVLVGAPRHDGGGPDAGAAFLFYGPLDGTRTAEDADLLLQGQAEGDYAGYSAAGAGDLDGDGVLDLLVGSYGSDLGGDRSGAFHVVFGLGK